MLAGDRRVCCCSQQARPAKSHDRFCVRLDVWTVAATHAFGSLQQGRTTEKQCVRLSLPVFGVAVRSKEKSRIKTQCITTQILLSCQDSAQNVSCIVSAHSAPDPIFMKRAHPLTPFSRMRSCRTSRRHVCTHQTRYSGLARRVL